jgi:hypothetical protein
MSTPANVQSSEAIEAVRTALFTFVGQVGDALTEMGGEMRRVQDWLEHDCPRFWKTQTRLAVDQVNEAQAALHRCLMFPVGSERPACYEERMELKKAQARLKYCEAKTERVRHWMRTLPHELFEYEGRISQLVRLVEIDAPQAIGVLEKILRQLEEYRAVRAESGPSAYNDLALAKAIWPEDTYTNSKTEPEQAGKPAAARGQTEKDN